MTILIWLTMIAGVAPLAVALILLPPARSPCPDARALAISSLYCTLAFDLTFFWQELWLVMAKAMTPGLHPILYHNNHDWTGTSPLTELLQGAGAVATLASGAAFLALLMRWRTASTGWRLFIAWMAFQGLFQSLTQIAIGIFLPGNDVGRAFAFLGFETIAKALTLGCTTIGLAAAGTILARHWPAPGGIDGGKPDHGAILEIGLPAAAAVLLLIPFRLPREMIEVVLVPVIVDFVGIGWVVLGMAPGRPPRRIEARGRPNLIVPVVSRPCTRDLSICAEARCRDIISGEM
jgi:hypothetical protein